jgi:hypothetical protein
VGWMDKENVYMHNGVVLNHYGEWNYVVCYKTDGTRDCHVM